MNTSVLMVGSRKYVVRFPWQDVSFNPVAGLFSGKSWVNEGVNALDLEPLPIEHQGTELEGKSV